MRLDFSALREPLSVPDGTHGLNFSGLSFLVYPKLLENRQVVISQGFIDGCRQPMTHKSSSDKGLDMNMRFSYNLNSYREVEGAQIARPAAGHYHVLSARVNNRKVDFFVNRYSIWGYGRIGAYTALKSSIVEEHSIAPDGVNNEGALRGWSRASRVRVGAYARVRIMRTCARVRVRPPPIACARVCARPGG